MKLQVRPALLEDAKRIELREEDRQEAALYPGDIASNLQRSILESRPLAFTAVDAGAVIALWGVCRTGEHLHPWLMCSERVAAHPRALLRLGSVLVSYLRMQALPAWNWVGKRSTGNQRFLRRLGFVIVPSADPHFDLFYLP